MNNENNDINDINDDIIRPPDPIINEQLLDNDYNYELINQNITNTNTTKIQIQTQIQIQIQTERFKRA